jgi:hypothetical protein
MQAKATKKIASEFTNHLHFLIQDYAAGLATAVKTVFSAPAVIFSK